MEAYIPTMFAVFGAPKDRFGTQVVGIGSCFTVCRRDEVRGWGQHLRLRAVVAPSSPGGLIPVEVYIGPSATHEKTVLLPGVLRVDSVALNAQKGDWSDLFDAKVQQSAIVVTRKDSRAAWGQELVLRAFVRPVDVA